MPANLIFVANPAAGRTPERYTVPGGTDVAGWLFKHDCASDSPVALNGHPVPACEVPGLFLRDGDTLHVIRRPGEAISVAAFIEFVAELTLAELVLSAVATAAAVYGVNQLYQGLLPPALDLGGEGARTGKRSQVSDGENILRPFEPTDMILGELRVYPPHCARSYTQVQGGRLYQHSLYCISAGPIDIADPKYADQSLLSDGQTISFTAINELGAGKLEGVRMEFRKGTGSEPPITLFTRNVVEEYPRQVLTKKKGWVYRNTRGAVRSFTVIISFPEGLVWIKGNNATISNARVRVHIEWRKAGTQDAWQRVTINAVAKSLSSKHYEKTVDIADADVAEYTVRTKRVTDVSPIEVKDKTTWSALLSEQPDGDLIILENHAYVAARWRLTGELSAGASRFNVIGTTIGKKWNGSVYVAGQKITSPSDLSRHVLQSQHNARAVADSLLELSAYQDWADDCTTEGYEVGMNARGKTTLQVLQRLAQAGRASFDQVGGKFTIVRDLPLDTVAGPDLHITPRNSWGFAFRKELSIKPHGLRIQFTNRDTGFLADELEVYATGFTAATATEFDRLDMEEVIDGDAAEKLGQYHLDAIEERAQTIVVQMDIEWMHGRRGSWARVMNDVARFGESSGRIVSVTKNGGGDITDIELDTVVTMAPATAYVMRFRTSTAKSVVASPASVVVSADGNRSTVTLSPFILAAAEQPAARDLWMFGTSADQEGKDYKVISITPGKDHSATVKMQPAAETILSQVATPNRPTSVTIPPANTDPMPAPFIEDVVPIPGDGGMGRRGRRRGIRLRIGPMRKAHA